MKASSSVPAGVVLVVQEYAAQCSKMDKFVQKVERPSIAIFCKMFLDYFWTVVSWFWIVVLDRSFGPWFWTVVLDHGFGPWFWTVVIDRGFEPWFWTMVLDCGFGLWSWTMV